jgi:Cu-Zn family superoxide dismutase
MMVRLLPVGMMTAMLMVAGCAGGGATSMGKTVGEPPAIIVNSEFVGSRGEVLGSIQVTQEREGARFVATVTGLPPGTYGVHLHEFGRCDWPGFASSGGHFNPTNRQHGHLNPAGEHAGDLPNLVVGDDRRGVMDVVRPGLRLADGDAPLLDLNGASMMIHAAPDDYKTDPTGNSGARIACAILARQRTPADM